MRIGQPCSRPRSERHGHKGSMLRGLVHILNAAKLHDRSPGRIKIGSSWVECQAAWAFGKHRAEHIGMVHRDADGPKSTHRTAKFASSQCLLWVGSNRSF